MADEPLLREGTGPAWRQTSKVVACTALALGACAAATQSAARRDVLYQEPMGKVYTGYSGAYSYQVICFISFSFVNRLHWLRLGRQAQ
jgi:hypothetical protein